MEITTFRPLRVLILSSGTGGGHDMRARAFTAWAERAGAENWQVQTHQALESAHALYRHGVQLYNVIQRRAPVLHHLYFNYLEVLGTFRHAHLILGQLSFRALLERVQPHVIVSVHGSTNHGFFDLARKILGRERVRCVTYCGELSGGYGFSRHWVNPQADLFIGAVPETCEAARTLGMALNRQCVGGFLLKPDFYEPPLTATERQELLAREFDFNPEIFTLLLSTGANGANNHQAFLQALERLGISLQVVVLCGNNQRAYDELFVWTKRRTKLRVRLLRQTDRMAALMQCADAMVARPGTGTTSEAIQVGCPLLLNGLGGVMPQEWITVKFCRKHELAPLLHAARDLPQRLEPFLHDPQHSQKIRAGMLAARPAQNPRDILALIAASVPAS